MKDGASFEETEGLLNPKHPDDTCTVQVVVPESVRPKVLALRHYVMFAGIRSQNRVYYGLRRHFYWPHMAADA